MSDSTAIYKGCTEVGGKLPNGAHVLARRQSERGHYVILADTGGRSVQRYVTWVAPSDMPDGAGSGNYFTSLAEASQDWEARR